MDNESIFVKRISTYLWALMLLYIGSAAAQAPVPDVLPVVSERGETLIIGRVSTNPKKHYQHLKPMVDYLAAQMADAGIKKGKVVFAKDSDEMIELLKLGKVDLISESPFLALTFHQSGAAEIFLRRWKKGTAEYRTVMISHKDGEVNSLSDLKGKKIAFQNGRSTTSFYVPAAIISQYGYDLIRLDSLNDTVPDNKVGYVFANKEVNIAAWLSKRLVDAGAISNIDWQNESDMPPVFKKDIKIIYESELFPRSVELVRTTLEPKIKLEIKELLLRAHESIKGKEALYEYQKTKRYDEISLNDNGMTLVKDLQDVVMKNLY